MNTVLGRCGWRRWQGLGLWAWTSPERHRLGVQRLVQSEEAAGSLVQGRGDLSLPSCLPSANPTKELLNTHGTGIRMFLLTVPRGNGWSCAPPQTGSYSSDHAFLLCDNVAVQSVAFVCWALAWPVRGLDTGPLSDRRRAEAQAHLVSRPSPPRCLSTEEMPKLARARSWPCSTLNSPLNPKVLRSASN